jgi:hypothetical protein
VSRESPEIIAARRLAEEVDARLARSQAFARLDPAAQASIRRDLNTIRTGLGSGTSAYTPDPYAFALETPADLRRRRYGVPAPTPTSTPAAPEPAQAPAPTGPRVSATESIARRAGALRDEIDFPAFVAGLVHGTFDAVVDASIRQMESFADLVSAVARTVDEFTRDNVTTGQVIDWLIERYPNDLQVDPESRRAGKPRLIARHAEDDEENEPLWLADFGLDGWLTQDVIDETLIPAARRRIGESRHQMLATMVLMGMNRINVKDGSISAKVRFRAAARDTATVNYAVGSEPTRPSWTERGSTTYAPPQTMVSSVGVNVQADADLKAELFGEVRINFVSETLPLERFADPALLALLTNTARPLGLPNGAAAPATPAPTAPTPTSEPPVAAASPPPPTPAPAAPPAPSTGG